jgi:O-acetyl-ADP-ribose deacetylase (regulator of RNase III)
LELALKIMEVKTVAFCGISTGVFGFPKQEASHIAIQTVNERLNSHVHRLDKIIFKVFSDEDYKEYLHAFDPNPIGKL